MFMNKSVKIAALLFSDCAFRTVKVILLLQSLGYIVEAVERVILTMFESLIWEILVAVLMRDDLREVILTGIGIFITSS